MKEVTRKNVHNHISIFLSRQHNEIVVK
jgi:hypothetical protein